VLFDILKIQRLVASQAVVSIALHERHGFTKVGSSGSAGFKFGRWLDLTFHQLTLIGPSQPVDDA
jgi:L-amino acid N-acyltransferase YncA